MNIAINAAALVAAPTAALASVRAPEPLDEPDPIFAVIEAHRRATEALNNVLRAHWDLEAATPADFRQSSITAWEEKIVETDAAAELASVLPTTTAGAAALLAYAVEWPRKIGCNFPDIEDENGTTQPFEFFVIQNCAQALAGLSRSA
jgi:hypothetical protein